jgi:hypothetical protein
MKFDRRSLPDKGPCKLPCLHPSTGEMAGMRTEPGFVLAHMRMSSFKQAASPPWFLRADSPSKAEGNVRRNGGHHHLMIRVLKNKPARLVCVNYPTVRDQESAQHLQ